MRLVIASDKFKGSLTAAEVAAHFAAGARRADPAIEVIAVPVADGGEGTLDAALAAGYERHVVRVTGPTGTLVDASFALREGEAVVEMAQASGLDLLPGGIADARGATSFGTGELIAAALDAGAQRIVLAIGGSASTDGGAGILQALGVRLLDAAGAEIARGGAALTALAEVDLRGLDRRLAHAELVLASDVDNPLLGERGAAAVFGPQKGATPTDVRDLDEALRRLVDVLSAAELAVPAAEAAVRPGAGAAGGVGFVALALGAKRRPGIDVVLELTGLERALVGADAVITGEGSLDAQSLGGKTPLGVLRAASRAGIPVHAVCGRSLLQPADARRFASVRTLGELESDPVRSMAGAAALLERLAEDIVSDLEPLDLDTVLRGRAYVDGAFREVEIGIRSGRIARIEPFGTGLRAAEEIEVPETEVILPGLVDTHVHVNEPGRTEWEGFASATRAAAAGGVTTIVDMPLNSIPPTVSPEALDAKRAVAEGQVFVDVGFWGGVIPGNLDQLAPLVTEGVFGFKCFLLPSGVDEFPEVSVDEMRAAMTELARHDSLLVVHAEDAHVIAEAPQQGGRDYADFLASRPRQAEDAAIAEVIRGAADTGVKAHILHLSNGDSLDRIARAREEGVRLSVETCPHYLTLTAEDVPAGATAFKCCPPIREHANRNELWDGLVNGTIDFVVSDHSPATPELKYAGDGDFAQAWGGIASLQLGLPLVWTEARERGIALETVVHWMTQAPADRVGLTDKGRIAVGAAADFALFAPDEHFTVDAAGLEHRHPVSPYDGRELVGVVRHTLLAGTPIDREQPRGRLLRRGAAIDLPPRAAHHRTGVLR